MIFLIRDFYMIIRRRRRRKKHKSLLSILCIFEGFKVLQSLLLTRGIIGQTKYYIFLEHSYISRWII